MHHLSSLLRSCMLTVVPLPSCCDPAISKSKAVASIVRDFHPLNGSAGSTAPVSIRSIAAVLSLLNISPTFVNHVQP